MNERDTVNAWLKGLWSPEAEFTLDEVGSCAISIDDVTACFIEVPENEGRVRFFSPVLPLPEAEDDDDRFWLYSELLKMNMPGGSSCGGTLAIDYGLDAVILRFDKKLHGMDGITFANVLGGIVSTVRNIRKELYGTDGTEDPENRPSSASNIPKLQPNWIQA